MNRRGGCMLYLIGALVVLGLLALLLYATAVLDGRDGCVGMGYDGAEISGSKVYCIIRHKDGTKSLVPYNRGE